MAKAQDCDRVAEKADPTRVKHIQASTCHIMMINMPQRSSPRPRFAWPLKSGLTPQIMPRGPVQRTRCNAFYHRDPWPRAQLDRRTWRLPIDCIPHVNPIGPGREPMPCSARHIAIEFQTIHGEVLTSLCRL